MLWNLKPAPHLAAPNYSRGVSRSGAAEQHRKTPNGPYAVGSHRARSGRGARVRTAGEVGSPANWRMTDESYDALDSAVGCEKDWNSYEIVYVSECSKLFEIEVWQKSWHPVGQGPVLPSPVIESLCLIAPGQSGERSSYMLLLSDVSDVG